MSKDDKLLKETYKSTSKIEKTLNALSNKDRDDSPSLMFSSSTKYSNIQSFWKCVGRTERYLKKGV